MVANNGSIMTNGNLSGGQMITLNIHVLRENINQAMQFDVHMYIADVLRSIQGHLPIRIDQDRKRNHRPFCRENTFSLESDYGLFVHDIQQPSRCYWLEPSRPLNYYPLKSGVRA